MKNPLVLVFLAGVCMGIGALAYSATLSHTKHLASYIGEDTKKFAQEVKEKRRIVDTLEAQCRKIGVQIALDTYDHPDRIFQEKDELIKKQWALNKSLEDYELSLRGLALYFGCHIGRDGEVSVEYISSGYVHEKLN